MKYLIFFVTCLSILNAIFSLQKEINTNSYNNIQKEKNIALNDEKNILDCLLNNLDFYLNLTRCVIEISKNNTQNIELVFSYIRSLENLDVDESNKKMKAVVNVLKNSIRNGLIDDLYYFLRNNTQIFDNILIILDEVIKQNNLDYIKIAENMHELVKLNGTELLLNKFYNASSEYFFDLIGYAFEDNEKLNDIFKLFKDKLGFTRVTKILDVLYGILKYYYDNKAIIKVLNGFFMNDDMSKEIKEIMHHPAMKYFYNEVMIFDDKFAESVKYVIFNTDEGIDIVFDVLQNETLVVEFLNILAKIDEDEYLGEHIPILLSGILAKNSSHVNAITNFALNFIIDINKNSNLKSLTLSTIQQKIGEIMLGEYYNSFNVSDSCLDLFFNTFLNYNQSNKNLPLHYFQKLLLDSSSSKGNFLTFDNCLDQYNKSIKSDKGFIIYPAFIIGVIDYPLKLKFSKNSSFYYKNSYVLGYCLPFGFRNEEDKKIDQPMCNQSDYNVVFALFLNLYNNETKNASTFFLHEENRSPNARENIYGIIGLLILAIPLIIYFIIIIIKNMIIKKQKRNHSINELIGDNIKNNRINTYDNTANKNKIKIIYPKYYLFLNQIFNIFINIKHLFNFSLIGINYNNVKGMTYIKGLIGISIIFSIFGQTFMALANLPSKEYGIWGYYGIMMNYIYIVFYIGYRYSPRILFSCSGYSLAYKYVCYLEQEENFYFLKFLFLQSYKYILLFSNVFFIRYLLYYINILIRQTKRPIWEIFKHFIDNESSSFFLRFFSLLFSLKEDGNEMKQNLIIYFYMPINEIVFFILGTILISIGFKYKLRIDLFILISIIIIYIAKIIIFFSYWYPNGYLATTDYYLVDYGLYLTHPLFNITCFLIGMYFGLINYSIQKGINKVYKDNNNYNDILYILSEEEKRKNKEENNNADLMDQTLKTNDINYIDDKYAIINRYDSENDLVEINNIELKHIDLKDRNNLDINKKNKQDNEIIDELFEDENKQNSFKKKEYSDNIKRIPFLVSPIKFINFHRNNKDKCFLFILTILAFVLMMFFIMVSKIFIYAKLDIDENKKDKNIVSKLSFESILPDLALNIFYSIDIEIVVLFIQWGAFLLYFKQVEIIRSFLNHSYWSFFVKTYFSFMMVSPNIILFTFYQTETVIKLDIYNLIIYGFIFLILIFILVIGSYSFYELPIKKIFKYLLKGKEVSNFEEDYDEEDEDSDSEDNDENKILKDND